MNKPAPKEPSMDEILSSIRQIIADDDAAVAPRKPAPPPTPSVSAAPVPPVMPRAVPEPEVDPEPLALTPDQMLPDERSDVEEASTVVNFSDAADDADDDMTMESLAQLVDPEDIAFESDELEEPEPVLAAELEVEPEPEPEPKLAPMPVAPPVPPRGAMAPPPIPRSVPRPEPTASRAAPMPDPTLSSDMAEKLIAPTTDAAVKHTFAKLGGVSMAGASTTIDGLMREMLKPMLKEWLDENLPSVVERMVEKEIARVSRGGE